MPQAPRGLPGSYVQSPNFGGYGVPQTSAQNLPTATTLPWAGGRAPGAADHLSSSLRQLPGAFQPPPQTSKLPGPTLGQVAGLGGSSWARGRTPNPAQAAAPPQPQPKNRSWVPEASAPPKPPLGSAAVPTTMGFDWAGSANVQDILSKTSPNLGVDWLSSSIAAFKVPGLEEKSVEPAAAMAAPSAALATLATIGAAPPPTARPAREGCHLRFNTGSSSRQHPAKQAQGIPNADATEESPMLVGVCDGVSGCTKLGISPEVLPQEILSACRTKSKEWIAKASNSIVADGHWLIDLMQDAFDSTSSMGATTMLLASIHDTGTVMTANIGDCSLVILRVIPAGVAPARLQVIFKTTPTRYEASKPVQVQRLPHMPEERTHTVIRGSKLDTCPVQSGDYMVMGSDGLWDNLQDEDILRVVERHCPLDRAAPTAALNEAAAALVNTAIAHAQPNKKDAQQNKQWPPWHTGEEEPKMKMNPDDTTALVAAVVEVPDIDEYERWFWRSRGIQKPYAERPRDASRGQMRPREGSVPAAAQSAKVPNQSPPKGRGPPQRAKSLERPMAPQPSGQETPLQDCTNVHVGSANAGNCPGPRQDQTALRFDAHNGQQASMPSFKGKGGGKGTKGQGKGNGLSAGPPSGAAPGRNVNADGSDAGAPDWWKQMAVPGVRTNQLPPAPQMQAASPTAAGYPGQSGEDPNAPLRLTSTILRAHEVKCAMAESIDRYGGSNANRGPPQAGFLRPPPIPEGGRRPMQGRNNNEPCVIS